MPKLIGTATRVPSIYNTIFFISKQLNYFSFKNSIFCCEVKSTPSPRLRPPKPPSYLHGISQPDPGSESDNEGYSESDNGGYKSAASDVSTTTLSSSSKSKRNDEEIRDSVFDQSVGSFYFFVNQHKCQCGVGSPSCLNNVRLPQVSRQRHEFWGQAGTHPNQKERGRKLFNLLRDAYSSRENKFYFTIEGLPGSDSEVSVCEVGMKIILFGHDKQIRLWKDIKADITSGTRSWEQSKRHKPQRLGISSPKLERAKGFINAYKDTHCDCLPNSTSQTDKFKLIRVVPFVSIRSFWKEYKETTFSLLGDLE